MTDKKKQILGSYVAGLWEGDGHITIAKNGGKPAFHINFNINEYPVAKRLLAIVDHECKSKSGSIRIQTKKNACVLNIYSIEGLNRVISLINGKLRSPKAYQIALIIHWLNQKNHSNIEILPLNKSNISDDAWLAGFIDADGSFGVERLGIYKQVVCKFRLAQRMNLPASAEAPSERNQSYKPLMNKIANYLGVKLNLRKQTVVPTNRFYYIVSMSSANSKRILRSYLECYSLLTSKHLDYKAWCCVDDLMLIKNHTSEKGQQEITKLKSSMNKQRTVYNWDHLEFALNQCYNHSL